MAFHFDIDTTSLAVVRLVCWVVAEYVTLVYVGEDAVVNVSGLSFCFQELSPATRELCQIDERLLYAKLLFKSGLQYFRSELTATFFLARLKDLFHFVRRRCAPSGYAPLILSRQ